MQRTPRSDGRLTQLTFKSRWRHPWSQNTFTRSRVLVPGSNANFLFDKRHLFSPILAVVGLTGFVALATPLKSFAFGVGLGLSICSGYLFYTQKKFMSGLKAKISHPERAVESTCIRLSIQIVNPTPHLLTNCFIEGRFSGSQNDRFFTSLDEDVLPYRSHTIVTELICDGGMGEKQIGDIRLACSDPLGLFCFELISKDKSTVHVFPRVQTATELVMSGTESAQSFGVYELPSVGHSTQFLGIREYRRGDSLRHIAWRLSAKHDRLMVKEYEKMTNAITTFILDLDRSVQAGQRANSTWEIAKDVLISLIDQHVDRGDSYQVISQDFSTELQSGVDSIERLTQVLYKEVPRTQRPIDEILVERFDRIPHISNVILILPFIGDLTEGQIQLVRKLRALGHHVTVVLIDGAALVSQHFPDFRKFYGIEHVAIGGRGGHSHVFETVKIMLAEDCRVFLTPSGDSWTTVFSNPLRMTS